MGRVHAAAGPNGSKTRPPIRSAEGFILTARVINDPLRERERERENESAARKEKKRTRRKKTNQTKKANKANK